MGCLPRSREPSTGPGKALPALSILVTSCSTEVAELLLRIDVLENSSPARGPFDHVGSTAKDETCAAVSGKLIDQAVEPS
jgi:hypothetical protein